MFRCSDRRSAPPAHESSGMLARARRAGGARRKVSASWTTSSRRKGPPQRLPAVVAVPPGGPDRTGRPAPGPSAGRAAGGPSRLRRVRIRPLCATTACDCSGRTPSPGRCLGADPCSGSVVGRSGIEPLQPLAADLQSRPNGPDQSELNRPDSDGGSRLRAPQGLHKNQGGSPHEGPRGCGERLDSCRARYIAQWGTFVSSTMTLANPGRDRTVRTGSANVGVKPAA